MSRSRLSVLCVLSLLAFSASPASPSLSPSVRSAEARRLIKSVTDEDLLHNGEEAATLFKRALKWGIADGDIGAQAMAHDGLGTVGRIRGQLQDALAEYRTSLLLWSRTDEPAEHALTLCNLGLLLLQLGSPEEALGFFGQAFDLLKRVDRPDVRLEVYDGIGLAFQDIDDPQRAISAYQQALGAAHKPEDEARILNRLALVYRDQGDLDRAWDALQQARVLAKHAGDARWEAFAWADLAHIEDLRGRDEQGLKLFDHALALLGHSPEPLPQSTMQFGRAEVLRDLGRLKKALEAIEKAIELVEPVRAVLEEPGLRVRFFSSRQRYYELYVTILMDLNRREPGAGWLTRAFEASDRSHSRSLLDDVAGEPTAQGRSLAEIGRELLDADSTLLTYSLGDRGSFLWVVNQDRVAAFSLPHRERIEEAAAQAWNHLSEEGDGPEVEELARLLLPKGIEPLLRKRLLISPDGALHVIPFALLHRTGQQPLIERHIISSLPSASYLVGMRRRLASRRPAPKGLAVLAGAVFEPENQMASESREDTREPTVGHLDPLVYSVQEALNILRLFPPHSRFKAFSYDASRETVLDPKLAAYQDIHIATHFIGGDHPDFMGLMLSRYDEKGRPKEGLVRASEIYNLTLPAELVVLSACGSGLGPRVRGEGPMGMTRAFLHAGAKRVVVSLWSVADETTTELMTRFYRQMLQRHLPPAEALRAAQLSMARDPNPKLSSPRAWAAFMLQGEPR